MKQWKALVLALALVPTFGYAYFDFIQSYNPNADRLKFAVRINSTESLRYTPHELSDKAICLNYGKTVRFFPSNVFLSNFIKGNWQWHYDSNNLNCEVMPSEVLECTVVGPNLSDVWGEFISPLSPENIVDSNTLWVLPQGKNAYPFYRNRFSCVE